MQNDADEFTQAGKIESLPSERRRQILAAIARDGRVVSRLLSREWGVSEDTIRRDIRELDDAGLVHRVHGGALPRSPQLTPYAVRAESNVEEKIRLGRAGAALIVEGTTALLYGGTTVFEAARHIRDDLRARIITNDPRIALETSRRPHIETLLIGGRVVLSSQLTVGSAAVDTVRALRADICLVGACGVHDEFGLSINDVEEAALQRAFVEAAGAVVALVTMDKLQTAAPFRVSSAAAITRIVTCAQVSAEVTDRYRRMGIEMDSV